MDWTSLIIALGIAGYGAVEYSRRESLQKERIAGLKKGILPSFEPPRPEVWRLLTTGAVEVVLLIFAGWLWYKGIHAGKYFRAFAQVAGFFSILALLVLVMLVNLIGRYKRKS